MPIDRISHLRAQQPGQRRPFCHSFLRFLCSNIGQLLVMIAYSVGGAFLFILLEQYVELQNCQQANVQENVSISNISESLYNYVAISQEKTDVIYKQVVSYLENFTTNIYDRKSDFRYRGQDCSTTSGWSFPSALLFTISIITSIGYGHITPTSWEGQITCICYSLIGIPIFLLCLTNMSSILGDIFRFLYSTFLHCVCCCCRINARRHHAKRGENVARTHGIEYVGTASVDPYWPEAQQESAGEKLSSGYVDAEGNVEEDVDDEMDDVYDRIESRVPILAVVSIIVGYIYLGAIMFNHFEGWTTIESVYFCYVTLSTIGFGDYVPGITSGDTEGLRFIAASFYIIIGLAILAMCFDLIKESIVNKFIWIAQKFGFISDDDDQVDNDITDYVKFHYSQSLDARMNPSHDSRHSPLESPPAYNSARINGH